MMTRRSALAGLLGVGAAAAGCRAKPARIEPLAASANVPATDAASDSDLKGQADAVSDVTSSVDVSVRATPAPWPESPEKERIARGDLALFDWKFAGSVSKRAVVLVPTHLAVGERVPLLILLHGLGETIDEELGAYAWVRRYGVGEGYAHARHVETISLPDLGNMITEQRVKELRAELTSVAFGGFVILCPFTPNIWEGAGGVDQVLARLGEDIFQVMLPRLRKETPMREGSIGLDGVSLGGFASLGIGLTKLAEIQSLGCLQAAISGSVERWTRQIVSTFAEKGDRPLSLLTSDQDVFLPAVESLHRALDFRKVPHVFRVAKGPHDQPFLRGPGSLEMLLFHDRALRRMR